MSRICVSAAGQSSLLNLSDAKGKKSCFQPLLSLCLTQAPAGRSVNQFWAGASVPPSVHGCSHSSVRAQRSSLATASKHRPALSRKLCLHSDCSNGKHNVNNVGHTERKLKQDLFTHLFFLMYISSCDNLFKVLKTRLLSQHGLVFFFETSQHLHFWCEKCLDLRITSLLALKSYLYSSTVTCSVDPVQNWAVCIISNWLFWRYLKSSSTETNILQTQHNA